ncbi:MAG TPA: hypothetical protein VGD07_21455 [Methylomirabilota bacterium]
MAPASLIERSVMALAAAAGDFSWPDFDRWQAVFTADAVFPARWDGLHAAPPPWTPEAEAYQRRKRELFSEWLDMLARRSTVLAHYARQGMGARIVRQDAGPACPVCDRFDAREVGPNLDTVPPFHPGCRCVLLAVHTAPARRRRRAYERPRSRAR